MPGRTAPDLFDAAPTSRMATWHPQAGLAEAALRGSWAVDYFSNRQIPVFRSGVAPFPWSNSCSNAGCVTLSDLLLRRTSRQHSKASPLWAPGGSPIAALYALPDRHASARAATGPALMPGGALLRQLQPLLAAEKALASHLGVRTHWESVAWAAPELSHVAGAVAIAPWAASAQAARWWNAASVSTKLQRSLGAFAIVLSATATYRALSKPPRTAALAPASKPARVAGEASIAAEQCPARAPSSAINFLAGLVAGVAVDVPLHPLDTVKTRLQAAEGFHSAGGFRGLWGGLSPVLLRSVPCSSLFFVTYEHTRHRLERRVAGAEGSAWCDATAGATANVIACSVRVPCEVLKQRMQAPGRQAALTLMQTARSVGAKGIGGFYTGFGATVSRELTFAVIQMPLFERLKRAHPWADVGSSGSHGVVGMTCGGVAGAVAGALTTPLDVAKTQIMLASSVQERRGVCDMVAEVYKSGGLRALFRGVVPRTLYVGVSCSLSFGAFEWSKSFLMNLESHGLDRFAA